MENKCTISVQKKNDHLQMLALEHTILMTEEKPGETTPKSPQIEEIGNQARRAEPVRADRRKDYCNHIWGAPPTFGYGEHNARGENLFHRKEVATRGKDKSELK